MILLPCTELVTIYKFRCNWKRNSSKSRLYHEVGAVWCLMTWWLVCPNYCKKEAGFPTMIWLCSMWWYV